ncbi:anaerobic sulfite reductase subunit AsrA [Ilyobacter polytropus]|uniref:Sulfite reductase, subunit A n=1 Tax=Ilyobacter polytropus (strain ATCC 51220 / DSM 2926 / LMG 16218 / CuHBu1) TaxID=572544 RepID=E3HCK5_ILYPC|nr:anaerobic sulfite reductase subunit AsrA [Ilyobacter polytropus]ADO83981.1 sulfite reductase, subunit A [Ilyobacter polytropus DSM 2926]
MKISLDKTSFDEGLKLLKENYRIFAPKVFAGEGRFSDTDLVKYSEIDSIQEICFDKKSEFSPKEVMLPITQTMFYFTEKEFKVPDIDDKGIIVFLRSCDLHSVKRVDEIYLRNKYQDMYYKRIRDKVKFVVMGCPTSFENCFCVSMGTNKTDDYHMGLNLNNDSVELYIKEDEFKGVFSGEEDEFDVKFVEENKVKVNVPENISLAEVKDLELWREYDKRCVACGKCNFVCPTCTCSTTQDIFYSENENTGERRRVWASCHVDGFTDMAGGHTFRQKHGDRMRFKTMHKISDFKRRFGYHMCTGCGRCDDVCPEYISFSNCVNKLSKELEGNDE